MCVPASIFVPVGFPAQSLQTDTADDGGDAAIRLTRPGVSPCLPPAELSEDSGGITRRQTRQRRPGQGWRMVASMMYVSALLLFSVPPPSTGG